MGTFLRILFLDPIGFMLACLGAAAAMMTAFVTSGAVPGTEDPVFISMTWILTLFMGWFAFLPMLGAIAVAEIFRLRSVFYWLAVGGGIGLAGYATEGVNKNAPLFSTGEHLAIYLGTGFVGGLVYWIVAGQFSGVMRRRPVTGPSGGGDKAPEAPPPANP